MICFTLLLFISVTRTFPVKVDQVDAEEELSGEEVILDRIARVNNLNMGQNNEVETNELNDVIVHEGDIIMDNNKYNNLVSHGNQNYKRTTYHDYVFIWKSKIIPYQIDPHIPPMTENLIEMALEDIQAKTCLSFRKRSREQNWIRFTRQKGCWSSVGRQSFLGAQNISIGTGCDLLGIVQHEVLHALGFFHEQSRPDRRTYVSIYWENILQGQESNFVRYPSQAISTLDIEYDYESILHYGNTFFSRNGRPTILATTMPRLSLGQRDGMSRLDYAKINVLYDCSFHQPDSWSQWSQFSPCDDRCLKKRQRFCYSEHPGHCDDALPTGLQSEVTQCPYEECYAPIDGHWSRWSRYTACSTSCGVGFHRRVRLCNDPHPAFGGGDCVGKSWELKNCRIRLCNLGRYDCDFTDSTCGWVQSSFDDFDWTRKSEGTPSINTGPDWDHTGIFEGMEESYGHFMYIEASGKIFGSRAILESGVFEEPGTSDSISKCPTFYYHMCGSNMGELNIYIVFMNGQQSLVWRRSGNQGNEWHRGMVDIASFPTYKIVLEGVRGAGYTSDIAVDDLRVLNQICREKSRIDRPVTPTLFIPQNCTTCTSTATNGITFSPATNPALPNSTTTVPALPNNITIVPDLPNTTPALPNTTTIVPALPNTTTIVPALPNITTIVPALPNNTAIVPALPNTTTIVPALPNTTTIEPALPNTTTIVPALPNTTTIVSALPNNTAIVPALPNTTIIEPALPNTTTIVLALPNNTAIVPVLPNTTTIIPALPNTTTIVLKQATGYFISSIPFTLDQSTGKTLPINSTITVPVNAITTSNSSSFETAPKIKASLTHWTLRLTTGPLKSTTRLTMILNGTSKPRTTIDGTEKNFGLITASSIISFTTSFETEPKVKDTLIDSTQTITP